MGSPSSQVKVGLQVACCPFLILPASHGVGLLVLLQLAIPVKF